MKDDQSTKSHDVSRRGFIQKSAALAGATAALRAPLVHASSTNSAEGIRIGLVGCGGRGKGAIKNRLTVGDNCKIVAVADAFEANAQGAASL